MEGKKGGLRGSAWLGPKCSLINMKEVTEWLPLLGLPTNNSRLIIDWDLYAKSIGSNRYPLMCSPPQTIYSLHAMF